MSGGRWFASMAAPMLLAALVGACNLIAGIPDKPEGGVTGGAGGAPVTCNVDADCDDDEPCTLDACGESRVCEHEALADGLAPVAVQTAGDCHTWKCHDGRSEDWLDDTDIADDGKGCTVDGCSQGAQTHTALAAGTLCYDYGDTGRCDAEGECLVVCGPGAGCTPPSPCMTGACDDGVCTYTPLPDGTPTPGVAQAPGDCHVRICLSGADVDTPDDSDVPATSNDCDFEVCTAGAPSHPPKTGNPPCSTFGGASPGHCDDAGACRECVADADCQGPTDDCRHPACVGFSCTEAFAPQGTKVAFDPPQVPGDCQSIVCDGNGGTMAVYDASDPENDGSACTNDVCALANVTQHNNVANGTVCGAGGTLSCLNGVCVGCTMNSQCPAASCSGTTVTYAQLCDGMGACVPPAPPSKNCFPYLCSAAANGCTTTCAIDGDCAQTGSGSYCTASNTCAGKLNNGASCTGKNQCKSAFCVDGRCCNSACNGACEACSAGKTGASNGLCAAVKAGTDPDSECATDAASTCGKDGTCDGAGACRKYASGTVCSAASCSSTVLTKPSSCNGGGTCLTPAPPTQDCAPYLCTSSACTLVCGGDVDCASSAYCEGLACTPKRTQGSACTAANQCQSGFCADGYCCNAACTAACKACSAVAKESGTGNGTCGAAKIGSADTLCVPSAPCGNTGLCAASSTCEKTPVDTACGVASCSGSTLTAPLTCNGTGSCNQGGASGPCPGSLVCSSSTKCFAACGKANATSDARCVSTHYCDGIDPGACQPKKATGASCARAAECLSAACSAGHCT